MYPGLAGERGTTTAAVVDLGAGAQKGLKGLRWRKEEAATAASASVEPAAAALAAAVTDMKLHEWHACSP
ncbi:hypothetical protein Cni_G09413 [Canna indica]|uniref:Uncharacterized protein n=1 Tax=Canna indica TaxID=4628 RepID=A0AAQ3K2A0_9LILI|nr:hypothetical protein Cni_G09412 [Canna indica]WOL00700.1 hypothetical protein Cni_G09413 [Canna indica]